MVFGEPDIEVRPTDGDRLVVEVRGLDELEHPLVQREALGLSPFLRERRDAAGMRKSAAKLSRP